jgi:DNA-binding CsgD family transcriptional regulator/tetratricopeptide (TPR) repeat protein
MSSSGPPPERSVPPKRHAEGRPVAWGKSLDLPVVGRDPELAQVRALLDDARAGVGGSLVLEGEAGIGKSTMLRAAEQLASGFRCLWVRGAESEQVLGHAGLLQAVGGLRDRLVDVPEAQAAALAAALGWRTAAAADERFLVAAATLSLLAAEAQHNQVLVLVDDVQWIDLESVSALAFAARRLQDDPVSFLWAGRPASRSGDLLHGLPDVPLRGLDRDAARVLVADRLVRRVADQLADATAGNPLAMLETAARLSRAQRVGAAALPERLPVGVRLQSVYEQLLSSLSVHARRAVLLCAVNQSSSTTSVRSALALEGVDVQAALDEAVDRAVLVHRGADVVFRHPLIRAAALEVASSAHRRAAHRTLAEVLSAASDRSGAAWHRAEATGTPDPGLAADLVRLADENRARKGYAAASVVLERAALLTTDPVRGPELVAAAANDAFLAGDVERARTLAGRVIERPGSPDTRATALVTLGLLDLYTGSVPRATEMLGSAVEVLRGSRLIRTLAELALARFRLGSLPAISQCAVRMSETVDRRDPEQRMLTDFVRGLADAVTGDVGGSQRLMADVIAQIEQAPLRDDPRSLEFLALAAGILGDVRRVFTLGEHLLALARERGAFGVLVPSLALSAAGRAWLGDNAGAFADAGEAVEIGELLGYAVDVVNATDMLAWQSGARGLHDDADRALLRGRQLADHAGTTAYATHLAVTGAFCAMCRGDAERAAVVLEARLVADGGVGTTGEPLGIAPDLVEAYVALGRRAEAARLAERFATVTPPDSPPLTRALAARTQGLAADDDETATRAFEAALAAHARTEQPFEAARTRLLYGARLRRSGQRKKAREQLERAQDAFAAMELDAWAARAGEELAASGLRARKRGLTVTEPLTSQETRVALQAVKGLSNKEIAAALFLSPKTVERHLSSVYRKRGVRSRTELAARFATGSMR